MRKQFRRILICAVVSIVGWGIALFGDRSMLNEAIIRFHVVANSDSETDQNIKLQVRDAVLAGVQEDLQKAADVEEAKEFLRENLPKIQTIANETLTKAGFDGEAVVVLCKEAFDSRHYDTFTLPAGIYESLRIVIGGGEGKNWWCVAFPTLCIPDTAEGFTDIAVGAGFSETLSATLTRDSKYEIHFYLLDAIGKLENIFFLESIIPCSSDRSCGIM